MQTKTNWRDALCSAVIVATFLSATAAAGEIAGAPPALLPTTERDFSYNFSNDFFGRGGSVDDFRTQQIIIAAKLNERWSVYLDHSILTLTDAPIFGRVDQLSASLGYSLLDRTFESGVDRLTVGGGLRGAGEYAGERMQNGFHRLIGSDIDSLPYVDTADTAVTAWVDGARYRNFAEFGNWSAGYWLRASALATSGGELDSSLSALAVASRGWMDVWLGLRHDWRSGYDADIVQVATAMAEEDTAVVFGMRFGAITFETVQQFQNDASYGQLVLTSSGVRRENKYLETPRIGIEFGFLLPDVEAKLAVKRRSSVLIRDNSLWRESMFLDFRYGQPQLEDDDSLYIEILHLAGGLEFERPVGVGVNWLSYYAAAAAGWRDEQLYRESPSGSDASQGIGRAVLTADTGVRFFAAALGDSWNFRLQLGVSLMAPLTSKNVRLGNEQFTLQRPSLAVLLGMTFDYD